MKPTGYEKNKTKAHYLAELESLNAELKALSDAMRQDKALRDEITAFRVKKTVAKLDDTKKQLGKTISYLNGAKIEPDAEHPLIMPGQRDLL